MPTHTLPPTPLPSATRLCPSLRHVLLPLRRRALTPGLVEQDCHAGDDGGGAQTSRCKMAPPPSLTAALQTHSWLL